MTTRLAMIFAIMALVLSVWIPKGVQAANPPEVNVASIADLFGKRGQLILWRGVGATFPGSQAAEASLYLLPDNDATPIKGYAADIGNKKAVKFGLSNSEFPTFVSPGSLSCTSSGKYVEATTTTWFLSGNKLGSVGETWVLDFDWRSVPATSGGGFYNLDCATGNPGTSITPNPNPPSPDPTVCAPVALATYLQDKTQLPQAAQLILVWGGNDKRFQPPAKWQGIATTLYKGLGDNCLMDGVVQMANDIGSGRATTYGGNAPSTIIWAPSGWNEKRVQQCTLPYSQDGLVIISDTLYGDSKCFTIIEYHDTQFVVPPPPPPPSIFRLFVPMVTLGGPQSICPDQSGWIPEISFTKNGITPTTWYLITGNYPTQPPGVNFWLRLRSADQTQWITQIGFTPMNGGNTSYDAEIYRGYAIPGDMTFIAKSNVQAGSVSIRITIRNILFGDCSRFFIVKVDDGAPPLS